MSQNYVGGVGDLVYYMSYYLSSVVVLKIVSFCYFEIFGKETLSEINSTFAFENWPLKPQPLIFSGFRL